MSPNWYGQPLREMLQHVWLHGCRPSFRSWPRASRGTNSQLKKQITRPATFSSYSPQWRNFKTKTLMMINLLRRLLIETRIKFFKKSHFLKERSVLMTGRVRRILATIYSQEDLLLQYFVPCVKKSIQKRSAESEFNMRRVIAS